VKLYYGFKQTADVRRALELCVQEGLDINPKMPLFSSAANKYLFVTKAPCRNGAGRYSGFYFTIQPVRLSFFKIPVDRVVELGIRIEL